MKKVLLLSLFWVSTLANAKVEVSENVEVYTGEGNLTVTLVRVLPLDANKALMRISGIDHELSNLVLMYDVKSNNGARRLSTLLHGRSYTPFVESKRWRQATHELYLAGKRDAHPLYFDKDGSQKADRLKLIRDHQEQNNDGRLSAIQRFDREREVSMVEKNIVAQQARVKEECGKGIALEVDWSSISDETMRDLSISSYCGNAYQGVERACANESPKVWVAQSVDKVVCAFGAKLRLKLDGKTLNYTTAAEAANQGDFVRYNLINMM